MRKKIFYLLCLVVFVGACSRYVAPVFTDVERMSQLRPGMSLKHVVDILGIEPYNIYDMQEDGSMVVAFNYRLKMRRIVVPSYNQDEFNRETTNEVSQTSGEEFYSKDYKTLYVLIKENKLVSYTTTDGINTSEIVLIHNNNLKVINEDQVSLYNNQADSISTATAVYLVHGPSSFKVKSDRKRSTENETFLKRLFRN